jgi:hypothetical protein
MPLDGRRDDLARLDLAVLHPALLRRSHGARLGTPTNERTSGYGSTT